MTDKREYVAGEPDEEAANYVEGQLGAAEDDAQAGAAEDGDNEPAQGADDTEETLARAGGWCPKEEWRGDPSQWVDAQTFNDTASPARMRQRVVRMEEDRVKERSEYDRKLTRIEAMSTAAFKRLEKEYEDRIKLLKEQREENVLLEAAANGPEAAKRLGAEWDAHIAAQEKDKPEVAEPEPVQTQPNESDAAEREKANKAGQTWITNKPWAQGGGEKFDRPAFAYAYGELEKIRAMPGMDGEYDKQFAELDKRMSKRFPEYYPQSEGGASSGNGQRSPPAPPANSRSMDGVRVSTKREGSYSSRLNATERRQGERFVKMGLFKNVEEYAKDLQDNG